jgi:hypothetical protein
MFPVPPLNDDNVSFDETIRYMVTRRDYKDVQGLGAEAGKPPDDQPPPPPGRLRVLMRRLFRR